VLLRFVPDAVVEMQPGVVHYAFLAPCTWRGRFFVRPLCKDGSTDRGVVHHTVVRLAVQSIHQRLAANKVRE
jgi:hypothetical protein